MNTEQKAVTTQEYYELVKQMEELYREVAQKVDQEFKGSQNYQAQFKKRDQLLLQYTLFIGLDLSKVEFQEIYLHCTYANYSKVKFTQGYLVNRIFNGVFLVEANFDEADLYNTEFSGCDLSQASFKGADLRKTKFVNCNLTQADFSGADLTDSNLEGSVLLKTNFTQANLTQANLLGTYPQEANFQDANLSKACLRGPYKNLSSNGNFISKYKTTVTQILDLKKANLEGANLKGTLYDENTRFPTGFDIKATGAYLIAPGSELEKADLSNTNLYMANLSGANLSQADLSKAILDFANFSGANLTGATLIFTKDFNITFNGSNLQKAKIIGGGFGKTNTCKWLNGADFTEANLIDMAFCYAELNGAKLSGLNLQGFAFCSAYLQGADFSYSNLHGADFRGAILNGANFTGADLRGAQIHKGPELKTVILTDAKIEGTILNE